MGRGLTSRSMRVRPFNVTEMKSRNYYNLFAWYWKRNRNRYLIRAQARAAALEGCIE